MSAKVPIQRSSKRKSPPKFHFPSQQIDHPKDNDDEVVDVLPSKVGKLSVSLCVVSTYHYNTMSTKISRFTRSHNKVIL